MTVRRLYMAVRKVYVTAKRFHEKAVAQWLGVRHTCSEF